MSAWVIVGSSSSISAAAPATCGAAMLVPLSSTYCEQHTSGKQSQQLPLSVHASARADVIDSPGAATVGLGLSTLIEPARTGPRLDESTTSPDGQQSLQ